MCIRSVADVTAVASLNNSANLDAFAYFCNSNVPGMRIGEQDIVYIGHD